MQTTLRLGTAHSNEKNETKFSFSFEMSLIAGFALEFHVCLACDRVKFHILFDPRATKEKKREERNVMVLLVSSFVWTEMNKAKRERTISLRSACVRFDRSLRASAATQSRDDFLWQGQTSSFLAIYIPQKTAIKPFSFDNANTFLTKTRKYFSANVIMVNGKDRLSKICVFFRIRRLFFCACRKTYDNRIFVFFRSHQCPFLVLFRILENINLCLLFDACEKSAFLRLWLSAQTTFFLLFLSEIVNDLR